MSYSRRFKDEFVVVFDGENFEFNGIKYSIYGVTGVDIDRNVIQIRDDLMLVECLSQKQLSFSGLLILWDQIRPELVKIIKKKAVAPIGQQAKPRN